MPSIRFLVFKYYAYLVTLILLLGVIILLYFYYAKKGLVCVIITALFSCQPSSYSKYIKLNMCFFCNIKSVSNAKYVFLIYFTTY